jgi:hypothetical protein
VLRCDGEQVVKGFGWDWVSLSLMLMNALFWRHVFTRFLAFNHSSVAFILAFVIRCKLIYVHAQYTMYI